MEQDDPEHEGYLRKQYEAGSKKPRQGWQESETAPRRDEEGCPKRI